MASEKRKQQSIPRREIEEPSARQTASPQQEIPEENRFEDPLQKSPELLRSLLRGMPLPVHIWRRKGGDFVLVDCNRRMEEITAGKVREQLGHKASRIFADREDILADFETCFHERSIVERETLCGLHEGTEEMQVISTYSFSPPDFVVVTFLDITDRKRLEKQLLQSRKMQAVKTLAAGIAHEFNNALSIIVGNAELAKEDIDENHSAQEFLDAIHAAGMRARNVVRGLLDYSRGSRWEQNTVPADAEVASALNGFRASLPSGVAFAESIASDCRPIRAAPSDLQQILIHLCSNAVEALGPGGGSVDVSLKNVAIDGKADPMGPDVPEGDYLLLQVSDSGCGMEAEQMDRIFDPYFTTKEFGKGMGLSTVQGICNRLGARIHVQSRRDEGTVFRIFFPCAPPEKKAVLIPIRDLPTGQERILLVDDEAAFTAALSKMLQRLGYQVKSFTRPTEALESFEADPEGFDLIVSDMVMSPMAGDRLIERIKLRRPDISAILMSGLTDRGDLKEDRRALMDAVVRKPVSINEIAKEIRKVLDHPLGKTTMPA